MADATILRYQDTALHRSDLQLLQGRHYLNDSHIAFYFAHLAALYPSSAILFVPPPVSFLVANAPDFDTLHATLEPLAIHDKELVFFTINDNTSFEASHGGGSHWSLLVYCRSWNCFMHYDSSSSGINSGFAFAVFEAVEGWVAGYGGGGGGSEFEECAAPRQGNGYDCGLYVMEMARVICEGYIAGDERWFDGMKRLVNRGYVESEMRSDLVRLITKLRKQQQI